MIPKVRNRMWLLSIKDDKWHWKEQNDLGIWEFISDERMQEDRKRSQGIYERIAAEAYNKVFNKEIKSAKGTIQD